MHGKFGIARGISCTVASGAGTVVDYAFTGRSNGTGAAFGFAVSSAFGLAESVAMGSIMFGERIATASITAAQDSVDLLSGLFGNDEASFSLAAFGQLVRREWSSPVMAEHLPEKRYSLPAMVQALMAWAAIQNVTHFYTEIQWFQSIRELTPDELEGSSSSTPHAEGHNHVHVTDDTILPESSGQIVSAEIGQVSSNGLKTIPPSRQQLVPTLRRLLKLVLAGYGGVGMIFFGLPLKHTPPAGIGDRKPSTETMRSGEEALMKDVVDSLEMESLQKSTSFNNEKGSPQTFSWWNVLSGTNVIAFVLNMISNQV